MEYEYEYEQREQHPGPRQYRMPGSSTTAGQIAGAIATIIVGGVGIFLPEFAERIPFGFESAVVTVVIGTVAYLKREKRLRKRFEQEQREHNECVEEDHHLD